MQMLTTFQCAMKQHLIISAISYLIDMKQLLINGLYFKYYSNNRKQIDLDLIY